MTFFMKNSTRNFIGKTRDIKTVPRKKKTLKLP